MKGFDLNAPFPEEEEGGGWIEASTESAQQDRNEAATQEENAGIFKHQLEPAASLGIEEELDILHGVWDAWNRKQTGRLDDMLSALCEEVGKNPSSPARYQYLLCFYISKKIPVAFSFPKTYKVLVSFFSPSFTGASRKQSLLPAFASKLLFRAFLDQSEWPIEFVKVYLEDAIGGRLWVENESCKEFVFNILTAFDGDYQDMSFNNDDVQVQYGEASDTSTLQQVPGVKNRYCGDSSRQQARAEFTKALNQLMKSSNDPRVLIRFLMLGVCYEEIRVRGSTMLDVWLNNPVHLRAAKLLLERIAHHTRGTTQSDFETVANILGLRLNSSQATGQIKSSLSNLYTEVVVQLVQRRSEYSSLALKSFLTTELNSKVPQNFKSIAVVLKAMPETLSPERELALALKELGANMDNGARLPDVVCRLTKQLNREVSPFILARALLEPWSPIEKQNDSVRLVWLNMIIALATQLMVQAALPLASDEGFVLAISSSEDVCKEKSTELKEFSMKIMTFQVEALTWCTDVLNAYLPRTSSCEFPSALRRLLFLEMPENFSADIDLNCFQLVSFCMHASEEILARVILMGISGQYPMQQGDAFCIIEELVWRAASSVKYLSGNLSADNNQLPAAIIKLSSFTVPGVQRQPVPQVMFKDLYLRASLVVLAIAVHNPSTIGRSVWDSNAVLRKLMECVITESASFNGCTATNADGTETLKLDSKTEEAIAAYFTETSNDYEIQDWKGNLILGNDSSRIEKLSKEITDMVNEIDGIYELGRILRSCRNPNFLADIINSQKFPDAWCWLKKVMQREPEIAGMLPSLWQAELLYMHEQSRLSGEDMLANMQELQEFVYGLLMDTASSENEINHVISFLARKLKSKNSVVRSCGRHCFTGIFNCAISTCSVSDDKLRDSISDGLIYPGFDEYIPEDNTWLDLIEKIPTASSALDLLLPALQEALQYESLLEVIRSYLLFLQRHISCLSIACSVAKLTVQRRVLAEALLSDPVTKSLILEVLRKALEVCVDGVSSWKDADSDILKLILPQHAKKSLSVPRIVFDGVIRFLGSDLDETDRNNASYIEIVQLLFCGFENENRENKDVPCIELETGELAPLLSDEQAACLSRSRDIRLVKAGLSFLKPDGKVELLKNLGLPPASASCLLESLDLTPDASLTTYLSSARKRKYLEGCVSAISKPGDNPFTGSLRFLSQQENNEQERIIVDEPMPDAPVEEISTEQVVTSGMLGLVRMDDESGNSGEGNLTAEYYVKLRMMLQRLASGDESILGCISDAIAVMNARQGYLTLRSVTLALPVLFLLCEVPTTKSIVSSKFTELLLTFLSKIKSGASQFSDGKTVNSAVLESIVCLEKNLRCKLNLVDASEVSPSTVTGQLKDTLQRLLNSLTDQSSTQNEIQQFETLMQEFLTILKKGGYYQEIEMAVEDALSGIEMGSKCGLLAGFLSYLDPHLLMKDHYISLLKPSTDPESVQKLKMVFPCLLIESLLQNRAYKSIAALKNDILHQVGSINRPSCSWLAAGAVLKFLCAQTTPATGFRSDFVPSASGITSLAVMATASSLSWTDPSVSSFSMALQALIMTTNQGVEAMRSMVQQLMFFSQHSENPDARVLQNAAQELLHGLYMIYPITVGCILQSIGAPYPSMSISWMGLKPKKSNFIGVVRAALEHVFSRRDGLDAVVAHGFCRNIARRHPLFIVTHFGTIRILLQDLLQQLKGGDSELRAFISKSLVFTLELLELVRQATAFEVPNDNKNLELLLGLYFRFLQDLKSADKQDFAQFIARLAELLSQCVTTAGGRYSQMIRDNYVRVFQPALKKFGNIKKLANLLKLLENGEQSTVLDDDVNPETAFSEELVKVRRVLERYIRLQETAADEWDILGAKGSMLTSETDGDLLSTLRDLERASTHLPSILLKFEDCLIPLAKFNHLDVAEMVYVLLGRLVQHAFNRETTASVARVLLEQLTSSEDPAPVAMAARHSVHVFSYCEELQQDLLLALFRIGKAGSSSLRQIVQETIAFGATVSSGMLSSSI